MNKATREYLKNKQKQQPVDDITDSAARLNLCNDKQYLEEILKKYNVLEYYYQFRLYLPVFNSLTNDKIYHGRDHTELVILNCFEGALWEKLNHSQIRSLLVAAIFHDSKHSLGTQTDDNNIKTAIKHLKEKHEVIKGLVTDGIVNNKQTLSDTELKLATDCIRYTRFPYIKYGRIPTTEDAKPLRIIRDADLMNIYHNDKLVILDLYIGLYKESFSHKSVPVFLTDCTNFLNQIQWNSNWAKRKSFDLNWPQRVKDTISHLTRNINKFPKE